MCPPAAFWAPPPLLTLISIQNLRGEVKWYFKLIQYLISQLTVCVGERVRISRAVLEGRNFCLNSRTKKEKTVPVKY
ncbi:MAG: hypothetical protein JL50_08785 [Peptococcaceae bacterium BICA1-7]|nr:MAG: hypothetical protein JL50_08785 [Peptococcaceae bacterium BICA1-7]